MIHDTHLLKKILVQSGARVFLVLYEISDGLLIFERVTHWEGFPEHDNQPTIFQATPLELLKRSQEDVMVMASHGLIQGNLISISRYLSISIFHTFPYLIQSMYLLGIAYIL